MSSIIETLCRKTAGGKNPPKSLYLLIYVVHWLPSLNAISGKRESSYRLPVIDYHSCLFTMFWYEICFGNNLIKMQRRKAPAHNSNGKSWKKITPIWRGCHDKSVAEKSVNWNLIGINRANKRHAMKRMAFRVVDVAVGEYTCSEYSCSHINTCTRTKTQMKIALAIAKSKRWQRWERCRTRK